MTITITQSATAIPAYVTAFFAAAGGTAPYTYAVQPGGAGGTIDAATGVYLAPVAASSNPKQLYDIITATDAAAVTASAQILVGTPLLLFCEILQRELGLGDGRVYLWDQKIMQPTDSDLYIAVSVATVKPFANVNRINGLGIAEKYLSVMATVDLDIISRGPAARERKEEVIMALASDYAETQQELGTFNIGRLPVGQRLLNLSTVDGAAIPYRFKASVNLQYCFSKAKAVPYIDSLTTAAVYTEQTVSGVTLIKGNGTTPGYIGIYYGGTALV